MRGSLLRRSFLGGLSGAAVAAAVPRVHASVEAWAVTVDAHIRMRSGQDGRAALYFNSGDIWAQRPGKPAVRMFGMEICGFIKFARTADGNLEHVSSDLGAFKDPTTGEYLTTWTNPFNGKRCEVPLMGGARVNRVVVTADGKPLGLARPINGTLTLGAPVTREGIQWVTEDAAVLIPRPVPAAPGLPPTEKMVPTTSLATYSALEHELTGAPSQFVPVRVSGNEVSGWWPWMNMDDIEGFTTWRIFGSKLQSTDTLPPETARFLERSKPGWLASSGV